MPPLPIRRRTLLNRGGALLALPMLPARAQQPARQALVIGNASYPAPADLLNPVRDAEAVGEALARTGFGVTLLRNAGAGELRAAVLDFGRSLRGRQGTALLYYAGHGVQMDWRNYMLPVDAPLDNAGAVRLHGIDVADVLHTLQAAGTRTNIVVLDACRDNPFGADKGGARGLAPMNAQPGTFLAYATAPGHVAMDGPGGANSLYTAALVRELVRPQARIEDIFKRVRLQVRQHSQGRQVPWESTSLEDDFVFATGERVLPLDDKAKAQAFEAEKPDWQRVRDTQQPEALYAFLDKHPSGLTAAAAMERLDALQAPQVLPQAAPGVLPAARPEMGHRVGDRYEWQYRDGLTGLPLRQETWRVTAVGDGRVEFNDGAIVQTAGGSSVRNEFGIEFDPPLPAPRPAELRPGMRWQARSAQFRRHPPLESWVDVSFVVRGLEEVTVPAGTFQAWRVEGKVSTFTGLRADITLWMVAGLGAVRHVRRARMRNGQDDSWTRELMAFQHVPR